VGVKGSDSVSVNNKRERAVGSEETRMSSQSKRLSGRVLAVLGLIASLSLLCTRSSAQDQPAPKWELFGGYSFWYPRADVHGLLPGGLIPVSSRLESNPRGAGASLTYNFNRWVGLTLDTSTHWGSGESTLFNRIDDAALSNLSIGPKITFRHTHFSPFFEVLVGDHRLMPDAFHDVDKVGFMAGGGLDINLSRHVALRLLRADYVYSNYRYGPPASTLATELRGVRLQSGLNFTWGGGEPSTPPTAGCSVEPVEVFAGETVMAHANGSNFNPKRTIKYKWTGTGIKVADDGSSARIDTVGLPPGSYQVNANLSDGSKKGVAYCSAKFEVKQPRPPQVSCSAEPGTVRAGDPATIHSAATSPDNRNLSYSYSATSGDILSASANATLNTAGAPPGSVTVTCTVNDDRNPPLTASATTTVMVETPPPPPAPVVPAEVTRLEERLALHSIYFPTARPSATNPDGGLLESQQEVLRTLASDFQKYVAFKPDAHLILAGHADVRGSEEYNKALTQRRVERTKRFLVEQGVQPSTIDTRSFGKDENLDAEQIKQQMQENPELTAEDRQKMLKNLQVIVLANNRRVDVSLSTTGQQSVRRYPFNAKDALALISTKSGETRNGKTAVKKMPKRQ
jgi:outer membrane protein OmpA-like peptidoglycan-associated protein